MSSQATALSIRTARAEDAAALAGLSTQLGYPASADAIARRLEQIHGDRGGVVLAAVAADQRVLGWTHVVKRILLEEAAFAELAGLVVDAGARGAGVGALLLSAAEHWARTQGLHKLRVRSNVVRERAHGFYLRAGYTERKRQVVFEKEFR